MSVTIYSKSKPEGVRASGYIWSRKGACEDFSKKSIDNILDYGKSYEHCFCVVNTGGMTVYADDYKGYDEEKNQLILGDHKIPAQWIESAHFYFTDALYMNQYVLEDYLTKVQYLVRNIEEKEQVEKASNRALIGLGLSLLTTLGYIFLF